MDTPSEIDYKSLFERVQAENEDLKLKLWKAMVGRKYPFSTAIRGFRALSLQDRYLVILMICAIAWTINTIIQSLRGLGHYE